MKDMTPPGGIDYAAGNYPGSRLTLRAPMTRIDGPYVAAIGGLETFGRFVTDPYPDLVAQALGMPCLNLGAAHAGPDAYLADEALLRLCAGAEITVISITGAHGVQNAFFSVHSRRNDRIIRESDRMRAVFPDVDFSRYQFVRHLLGDLETRSPRRFALIREELQATWITRMNHLCARIGGDVVVLWMGDRGPDDPGDTIFDGDPPLVTRAMLNALRGRVRGVVEVIDLSQSEAEALEGKVCRPDEIEAALRLPGQAAHRRAAEQVSAIVSSLIAARARPARAWSA